MSRPVFVVPTERLGGAVVVLDGAEGRHAGTVRRIGVGEEVDLVDGAGLRVSGVVTIAARDSLSVAVGSRIVESLPQPRLVVVQALAKNQRDEAAVEAMTEIGVDAIVPWAASRSVVQWAGERGTRALAKWRTTAREAGKQARRARFPEVAAPASTVEVSELLARAALGVVLHEAADRPLTGLDVPLLGDIVIVVGPEGGISAAELAAFDARGAVACRLGATVLRTSTAGVAALAVLLARSGRWG